MDLFPSLGEPGILDDLFWFGPLAVQIILAVFFFWLAAKWIRNQSKWSRAGATFWMVAGTDVLLVILAIIVFMISNPTL